MWVRVACCTSRGVHTLRIYRYKRATASQQVSPLSDVPHPPPRSAAILNVRARWYPLFILHHKHTSRKTAAPHPVNTYIYSKTHGNDIFIFSDAITHLNVYGCLSWYAAPRVDLTVGGATRDGKCKKYPRWAKKGNSGERFFFKFFFYYGRAFKPILRRFFWVILEYWRETAFFIQHI